jgi:hypothetical protein
MEQASPFARLDWLLRNTARFLKSWNDHHVGNIKLQLEICKEVLHCLEVARDHRQILSHEEHLQHELKLKALALSSLCRTIARQESSIASIKEGDAPTHFFHAHANARQRKKFIQLLQHNGQTLVDENRKAEALFEFFNSILGMPARREKVINLDLLDLPQINLSELSTHFIEEEVLIMIHSMPPDEAPGPDKFAA